MSWKQILKKDYYSSASFNQNSAAEIQKLSLFEENAKLATAVVTLKVTRSQSCYLLISE